VRKTKKRWLFIVVLISLLSVAALAKRFKDVNAFDGEETTEVKPYKTPTGDVKKFLGIWMTSGYALQPSANSYVEVNKTVTLYTDAARSALARLTSIGFSQYYVWYESTDGKTWKQIEKGKSKNLENYKITPTEVGTRYYQQETYWKGVIFTGARVYSKLATVHALPEPVDAEKVTVTTDDDYLYNSTNELVNIQTYAHAQPDPVNSTGTITWSVDDTSLATIDENTGLITANTNEKSGPLTIFATMHNPNGTEIKGEKEIIVGGGLENQTVKVGNTATFELQGNIGELDDDEDNNYTVKWYKEDPITQHRENLDLDPKALSYTTPETKLEDDGTIVGAIIRVRANGKNYSYPTNEAYLYVKPEGGPNIEMTNTLSNETYRDKGNSDTVLFGVNNGDQVKYLNTLKNDSDTGTLSNAKYVLPLRDGTSVISVEIDNQAIDESNYSIKKNENTQNLDLTVTGLGFKNQQSHSIEVNTTVSGVTGRSSFTTLPYIEGTSDEDESLYRKFGHENVLHYTLDMIDSKPQDIDYGTINAITPAETLSRQDALNLPNNVLDVDDTRRNKTPLKVYVSQIGELMSGEDVLSGQLKYYDDGKSTNLLNEKAEVTSTEQDEPLNSIGWDKDNGVLLYMNHKWNVAGVYQTKLDWIIEDAP